MTWSLLVHRCPLPDLESPDDAGEGSVWACDSIGCGKRHTLTWSYNDGRNGAYAGYRAHWTEVTE